MSALSSYPKVYNVGRPEVDEVLDGEVTIQEKVDGSQFSFGRRGDELIVRSRGREFPVDAADDLFKPACETVLTLFRARWLPDGWTFRGEAFKKPKHNTISYERVPVGNVILFDIDTGDNRYSSHDDTHAIAKELGLETVALLYDGPGEAVTKALTEAWLARTSILGGSLIEGFVIKNYSRITRDGKTMMAKHVREEFKEASQKDFRTRNPTHGDVLQKIGEDLRNEMRWLKAVQRSRDDGTLIGGPQDIGSLMKSIHSDIEAEEAERVKNLLWQWARPKLLRKATAGFPEWYKERLLVKQLGGGE